MSYYYKQNKKKKISGTENADTFDGSSRNDKIYTFDGDDIVNSGAGNDRVYLGNGDDFVDGGSGADRLYGDSGNDIIIGGRGSDRIYGGDGDDIMTGDAADGSNGWRDKDIFSLGRVEDTDSGNDVITDFDTNNYCGGEWNYDKLSFTFNGRRFNLSEGHDLVWFTFYIEHDGDIDTDALRDGNDLIFVFERDENGYAKNSVRLEDVIGDDGITNSRLDWASVDDITNLDFDADVIAEDDVAAINDNDGAVLFGSVLDNDSLDNGLGSVVLVTDVSAGTLTLNADGTYSFNVGDDFRYLSEGETTEVSFTYAVTDVDGDTDEAAVTITITGTNDAPVAEAGTATGDEDTVITGQLVAFDVEGDTLTYSLETDASNGSVTVNTDGSFEYTPVENFNGTDSFTYLVDDGNGGTATETITFTVNPVNDAPVAEVLEAAGDEDTIINGQLIATDVDGDSLMYALVSDAANGTVTVNADGSFDYTATTNFNGTDSFTYMVDDGNGGTSSETVTLTINAVNDDPVAAAQAVSGDEDTSINGQLTASDVDGDTLIFALDTGAANGSVTVNGDGSFTYTPAGDFFGTDSFTYSVDDGNGGVVTETVTITLDPVNDDPVAAALTVSGDEDTVISGQLSATDVEGDALAYALDTGPSQGFVTVNADGSFDYTPAPNFFGADSFTYSVADGNGGISTETVTIEVNGVQDAPTANPGSITGDEDTVITGQLSANDPDGDGLTFTLDTDATNGTVTVNANGSYSYTPNPDFFGTDSFTYTVDDGNGGTAMETVNITVENVPDPFYGTLGPQTAPNAGRWFIIDFDAQTVTAEARTGGLEPPNPPTNGVVIHLNGNNSDWGVSALSYLNGVLTTQDPSEFSISNYTGGSFTNAIGFQLYEDSAVDADILWSSVMITPEGPYTYTITLDNIDFTDNSNGSISLDSVSVAVEPLLGYNVIIGTENGETLTPTSQDDYILGLAGDDIINDSRGDDIHFGGEGNDTIIDTFGDDVHNGGAGNDTITDTFGFDTISGGDGDDTIDAGRDDDTVYGDAGDDTLLGNSGNDLMFGGDGIDNMNGGRDDDVMHGDGGNDIMLGDRGIDLMYGGSGDDDMNGGRDNDTMHGESGNDMMVGDRGDDIMFGGVGDDTMDGGRDNDTLNGGEGNDIIRSGLFGDNTLNGGAGNDQLFSDFFTNNTMNGGTGDDSLTANNGIDTFIFADGDGHDTIKSYDLNQDKVDLTDFGFNDFSEVAALLSDTGNDILLTLSVDQSITFEGIRDITDLTVDDFLI